MDKGLLDLKKRLRQRYLGKSGIHGVGVRASENAICIYVNENSEIENSQALQEIKKEAGPFNVITIKEKAPKAM